jgi:hypothetical protein
MLLTISSEVTKVPGFIDRDILNFHKLTNTTDVDIIEKTLIVINKILPSECHIRMIIVSSQFPSFVDHAPTAFSRILAHLSTYPNILPFLCVLALRLGEVGPLGSVIGGLSNASRFRAHTTWFVFLVLVTFYGCSTSREASQIHSGCPAVILFFDFSPIDYKSL